MKEEAERRAREAEEAITKIMAEVAESKRLASLKDAEIAEY